MRNDFMTRIYDNSSANYTIERVTEKTHLIHISVSGNSAILLNPFTLITDGAKKHVRINRIHDGHYTVVNQGHEEILYPGRKPTQGIPGLDNSSDDIYAYDTFRLFPSPLHYTYEIKGISVNQIIRNKSLDVKNAITNTAVDLEYIKALPSIAETVSVHPWTIESKASVKQRKIIFSGAIKVTETQEFTENQTVIIKPGTTFRM